MSAFRRLLALLGAACLVAGCGKGATDAQQSQANPEEGDMAIVGEGVAAADTADVLYATNAINTACGLTSYRAGSDWPLDKAVRTLLRIERENPEGVFSSGQIDRPLNMRRVVELNADTLRRCGRAEAADRLAREKE